MARNWRPNVSRFFVVAAIVTLGASQYAGAATVAFQNGTASCSQVNAIPQDFSVDDAVDNVIDDQDGWGIYCDGTDQEVGVWETTADVTGSNLLVIRLYQLFNDPHHTLGHFLLSVTNANRNDFADDADIGGDVGLIG